MKKKRKPTDSTMRNVRAANKRIAALDDCIDNIDDYLEYVAERISDLYDHAGFICPPYRYKKRSPR